MSFREDAGVPLAEHIGVVQGIEGKVREIGAHRYSDEYLHKQLVEVPLLGPSYRFSAATTFLIGYAGGDHGVAAVLGVLCPESLQEFWLRVESGEDRAVAARHAYVHLADNPDPMPPESRATGAGGRMSFIASDVTEMYPAAASGGPRAAAAIRSV